MSLQDFRKQFEGLIETEPPPLQMEGMPGGSLGGGIDDSVGEIAETKAPVPVPVPTPAPAPKPKKKG